MLAAALAGVALFLALYGSHVLNPAYTDWLMDGGSLSKGFLGWRLFESTDWQFPPGLMATLGYPQQAPVTATDSVPLLAVAAKLLSFLYDGQLQYFGWWALACFLLQGVFGGLIALRVTRSAWQALLGSLLFLLSPVLWQNTFFSAGLAGHWVLLAGLALLVCRRELSEKGRLPSVLWGILGAVSMSVHSELALVCGIFCVGYCVYAVMQSGQWGKSLPFGIFLLTSMIVGWALGVFSQQGSALDIRFFGVSLWALWDPYNYSTVLRNLSTPGDYQYAGFAYLGFGALMLCALALVWWVRPYFGHPGTGMAKALWADIQAHRASVAAFAAVGLACVMLGLSQPIVYLLMLLALSVLANMMSRKLLAVVLACCLCLQVYDASTIFQARRMHYDRTFSYAPMAGQEEWAALLQNDAWSTVLVSPAVVESVHLAPLVQTVAQSGKTLNTLSYTSPIEYQGWESAVAAPQEDMVFVLTAAELLETGRFKSVFAKIGYLYQWDELVLGFVKPTLLPFPQLLRAADISYLSRYPIGKNEHLRGGEDIGGIRYIYPGGLSYGPYLDLAVGQYELRVTGERLDEARVSFTSQKGTLEPSEVLSLPTERIYRLNVSAAVVDFEILIENGTSQPLSFGSLTVTQLD